MGLEPTTAWTTTRSSLRLRFPGVVCSSAAPVADDLIDFLDAGASPLCLGARASRA
jgi:hypothetical protein